MLHSGFSRWGRAVYGPDAGAVAICPRITEFILQSGRPRSKSLDMKAILIPEELNHITPEWLESKGFVEYIPGNEDVFENFPGGWFDVEFDSQDLCYLEQKFDRKRFCIVLTPGQYTNGEVYYSFQVYIQKNVGMGFVAIPDQHAEMTEFHFSLLFEAIRREKLPDIRPMLPPISDQQTV